MLPQHYNFNGEQQVGARRFDDKDPYLAPGEGSAEGPRTTVIPPPLKTPLTAPVAGGALNASNAGRDTTHNVEGGHHG